MKYFFLFWLVLISISYTCRDDYDYKKEKDLYEKLQGKWLIKQLIVDTLIYEKYEKKTKISDTFFNARSYFTFKNDSLIFNESDTEISYGLFYIEPYYYTNDLGLEGKIQYNYFNDYDYSYNRFFQFEFKFQNNNQTLMLYRKFVPFQYNAKDSIEINISKEYTLTKTQ